MDTNNQKLAERYVYPPAPFTERGKHTCLDIHAGTNRILYSTANVVVIRDLNDFTKVHAVFSEHKHNTTAAKFSPNGNYVCSGDEKGFVIVWNAVGNNLIIKKQWDFPQLTGAIRDIAWTFDSERIAIAGEGQKIMAKVFAYDTGSQLGEISGQSKNLLTCSFKPSRPFRLATAGEEFAVQFYEGPPFKFKRAHKPHTSFINCLRFCPKSEKFITVSSDKKVFLYDAVNGDLIKEIFANGHTGGIIYCDWFEDGNTIVTASSDKLVRIWSLQDEKLLKTLRVSENPQVEHQQVSVKVNKQDVYSITLNGHINVWKNAHQLEENSLPTSVLVGHQNSVNQISQLKTGQLVSSDINGRIIVWDNNNIPRLPDGKQHEAGIVKFKISKDATKVFSFCNSQKLNTLDLTTFAFGEQVAVQGKTIDLVSSKVDDNTVYLLQENLIKIYKNREQTGEIKFQHSSTVFDVSANDSLFAIGNDKGQILLINLQGEKIGMLENYPQKITAISFSHDGKLLLCGDSGFRVNAWDVEKKESLTQKLVHSSQMITSVKLSPNGKYILTSSLDNKAIIYESATFNKVESFEFVHKRGMNYATFGQDGQSIITCGSDNLIKVFNTKSQFNA
ncbi:hypothetical protein ABPG74_008795 [Tetrahymena malaccensis]